MFNCHSIEPPIINTHLMLLHFFYTNKTNDAKGLWLRIMMSSANRYLINY